MQFDSHDAKKVGFFWKTDYVMSIKIPEDIVQFPGMFTENYPKGKRVPAFAWIEEIKNEIGVLLYESGNLEEWKERIILELVTDEK